MTVRQSRMTIPIPLTFAAILALVAISGCGSSGTADDKQAAEWTLEHGGTIIVSGKFLKIDSVEGLPDEPFLIRKIDLNQVDPPITDKDLEQLPVSENLESLGLHSAQITDKGIEPLLKFSGLKELELSYTKIGDVGLEQLAGLKKLTKLFLYGILISDEAMEEFKKKRPDCTVYQD